MVGSSGGENCKLLLCPLRLPLHSPQSVHSLLKNCILYIQNRRLLDQFGMECFEVGECLGFRKAKVQFHGRSLRKRAGGRYGVLSPLGIALNQL
jgi:hypothetical protein